MPVIALLPLFLFFRIFKDRKAKIFHRIFRVILVSLFVLPFWISGYIAIGVMGFDKLGYITEPISIAGTGSMFPTFPKGESKTPQEQSKEIVGTPGMLRYPNGLVIFGKRIFGNKLGRGDIVVVENEKIREISKELTGEEAGWVKRIVALEGDELELKDGIFYLNGEPQKEPYIARARSTFGETFLKECAKVKVPEGHIFVMGDNRTGSGDSREVGFIEVSAVDHVLPLHKQRGTLDKNWRDTSKDLEDSAKISLDESRFIEILNNKRKQVGLRELKYEQKLEKSAFKRGEVILKYDDFSYEATKSGYTQLKAMNELGYSNIVWNEGILQGHYDAEELIDALYEFPDWKKNLLENKDLQEIGVADVEGNLNGCPSQAIVIHLAGYIPPNYEKDVIESWRGAVDDLNSIIPSWEGIKGKGWVNEEDLNRLLGLFYRERLIASSILSKMDKNQWLSKSEEASISEYETLIKQSSDLANKLNGN